MREQATFHRRRRWIRRKGAVMSVELLLVLPILVALIFAIVEFGFLWSANHRLHAASTVACRIATLPSNDFGELKAEIQSAASRVLRRPALVRHHRIFMQRGAHSGDPVILEIRVPMQHAAPDLLRLLGFRLIGRQLVARSVMRKE